MKTNTTPAALSISDRIKKHGPKIQRMLNNNNRTGSLLVFCRDVLCSDGLTAQAEDIATSQADLGYLSPGFKVARERVYEEAKALAMSTLPADMMSRVARWL